MRCLFSLSHILSISLEKEKWLVISIKSGECLDGGSGLHNLSRTSENYISINYVCAAGRLVIALICFVVVRCLSKLLLILSEKVRDQKIFSWLQNPMYFLRKLFKTRIHLKASSPQRSNENKISTFPNLQKRNRIK